MIIRDGTDNDARFAGVELATYMSGNRLIIVVNQSTVCVARLVLTPFDLGDGSAGLLQAIARHSLPVTLTLGDDKTAETDVDADGRSTSSPEPFAPDTQGE